VAWEIEVGRAVPLDRYPETCDWLVRILPGSAPALCGDDEGLVLRPHPDPRRHPSEVADTDHDVALWTIPREVFADLAASEREALSLRDYISPVGDGEKFYLASERDRLVADHRN
jgi:hypothetical protein